VGNRSVIALFEHRGCCTKRAGRCRRPARFTRAGRQGVLTNC
jgi:hypothetical protein